MKLSKMKILHIITGLDTGGAEMMLFKLLSGFDRSQFQNCVISLRDQGTMGGKIVELEVPLHFIGMNPGLPSVISLLKLVRLIKKEKPDLIQGWMYHGNIAASVAACLSRSSCPVLWNIRQSLYDVRKEKKLTRMVISVSAWLSKNVNSIIFNSYVSAAQHKQFGFSDMHSLILPNGFNLKFFSPGFDAKKKVSSTTWCCR